MSQITRYTLVRGVIRAGWQVAFHAERQTKAPTMKTGKLSVEYEDQFIISMEPGGKTCASRWDFGR